MTIQEVTDIFKKAQPYRRPTKYARKGDVWYIFSENTTNGGQHLAALIENNWFSVESEKVLPTNPLYMPKDISPIPVPLEMRAPYTPK